MQVREEGRPAPAPRSGEPLLELAHVARVPALQVRLIPARGGCMPEHSAGPLGVLPSEYEASVWRSEPAAQDVVERVEVAVELLALKKLPTDFAGPALEVLEAVAVDDEHGLHIAVSVALERRRPTSGVRGLPCTAAGCGSCRTEICA